jgi:iron complex outermembrane recepter protein
MKITSARRRLLAATAITLFAGTVAQAQEVPASDDDAAAAEENADIVVTGTSRARAALDTPLSITSLGEDALGRLTAAGQADILNSVPSIKADGGGGEVAANVFVRGLPSGGQYQFTPLMYDGIPVMSSFGLNSSAFDVYYRNDLGIERLEFVRGGVSNLFGPGSVAGLINYISRSGEEEFGGTVQLEVAERGRYRGDVALHGPIGENLSFALSGYYRTDAGPIRTGLDTEGYQLRGNLRYDFPDGGGHVTLHGQYIDDQVLFYLPIPLNGATRERAPGNDGRPVNSVQNNFNFASLGFNTPDGPFVSRIDEGVATRGGQIALSFDREFGGGWGINGRFKYSDYNHRFGLWSDGDGIINVPETLQSYLTNRNLGLLANAQFTYAGGGAVTPGSLLFANRYTDRERPMEDFTAELNLTNDFTTGSVEHTFTLGGFYADATASDINVTTTYLAEFNNRPRLVNLVVTNPVGGAQTIISRGGLFNAGAGYTNNVHSAERYAFYIADQMEIGDRFNLDIGFRWENFDGTISRERTATVVTDAATPNLSTALRDVIWGNGLFTTGNVSTDEWAAAIGALYEVTDEVNIYANASRGYFFPEVRSVTFNALFQPSTYRAEIIEQIEGGVKVGLPGLTFTASAFYNNLSNRRQVLFVNDGAGGFREQVNLVGTRAWGVEGTIDLRLYGPLRFAGNITLQNSRYTDFDTNLALIGNDLERQPQLLYNAGLYYDDGALDAAIFTNYTGANFTASNNLIRLQGWNVFNLDAGYRIGLGGDRNVRLGVNVFNLFNEDAVTEGSPRQDNNQATGGAFFVGRPVLPRRITARLTFDF